MKSVLTIHQVISLHTGKILDVDGDHFPVLRPGVAEIVIVVVEPSERIANSVVKIRSGPVDRVAVCIRRNTVGIDGEGSLLRVGHAVVGGHPIRLDEPLNI